MLLPYARYLELVPLDSNLWLPHLLRESHNQQTGPMSEAPFQCPMQLEPPGMRSPPPMQRLLKLMMQLLELPYPRIQPMDHMMPKSQLSGFFLIP